MTETAVRPVLLSGTTRSCRRIAYPPDCAQVGHTAGMFGTPEADIFTSRFTGGDGRLPVGLLLGGVPTIPDIRLTGHPIQNQTVLSRMGNY